MEGVIPMKLTKKFILGVMLLASLLLASCGDVVDPDVQPTITNPIVSTTDDPTTSTEPVVTTTENPTTTVAPVKKIILFDKVEAKAFETYNALYNDEISVYKEVNGQKVSFECQYDSDFFEVTKSELGYNIKLIGLGKKEIKLDNLVVYLNVKLDNTDLTTDLLQGSQYLTNTQIKEAEVVYLNNLNYNLELLKNTFVKLEDIYLTIKTNDELSLKINDIVQAASSFNIYLDYLLFNKNNEHINELINIDVTLYDVTDMFAEFVAYLYGASFDNDIEVVKRTEEESLAEAVKEGYTFKWMDKNNNEVTSIGEEKYLFLDSKVNSFTTVFYYNYPVGEHTKTLYKVTGNYNTEVGSIQFDEVEGWELKGWSIDPEDYKIDYKAGYDFTHEFGKSEDGIRTNLYGVWDIIDYTIKFDSNVPINAQSVLEGNMADVKLVYNQEENLSKNQYKLDCYRFLGWSKEKDGLAIDYQDEQLICNLSTTDGENITLYAVWEISQYLFNYNLTKPTEATADIVGAPAIERIDKDVNYTIDQTSPSLNGWSFVGWTRDNINYSSVLTNGDVIEKEIISNNTNEVINLYPVWKVDPLTISEYTYNDLVADSNKQNKYHIYKNISSIPISIEENSIIDLRNETILDFNKASRTSNIILINGSTDLVVVIGDKEKTFDHCSFQFKEFSAEKEGRIIFKDFKYQTTQNAAINLVNVKSTNFRIDFIGECFIKVNSSGSVLGSETNTTFNRFNTLNIYVDGNTELYAGNGANGTKSGEAGKDGGTAVYANVLNVTGSGSLKIYGGKGGAGATGATGSTGNPNYSGWDDRNAMGGGSNGGQGGTGGVGGNGAKGGYAVDAQEINGTSILYLYGGKSGDGGRGGTGGTGGKGQEAGGWGATAGNGGKGGTGGKGGDAYKGRAATNATKASDAVFLTVGEDGKPGDGGYGGTGGEKGIHSARRPGQWATWGNDGNDGAKGDPGKAGSLLDS